MSRGVKRPIEIAGGGLAGLSLGLALLRRGVDVTLHEAGRYPRHRVCGEFISGVSEQTLTTLGLQDIMRDCLRHEEATWYADERLLSRMRLPQAAYGISRYALDQILCTELRGAGGVVVEDSRVAAEKYAQEGVVCATGRKPTQRGQWIGLKMHVREAEQQSGLEMHLGSWGYVGMSAVEDGWTNVCGLFRMRDGVKAAPEGLLSAYTVACGMASLGERLSRSEKRVGSFTAVAGFTFGRQIAASSSSNGAQEELRIGDAESIIPPFTGNGMSMALESAAMAVEPIVRYAEGRADWSQCLRELHQAQQKRFRRRLWVAGVAHQTLLNPQWRRPVEILAEAGCLPLQQLFFLTRT